MAKLARMCKPTKKLQCLECLNPENTSENSANPKKIYELSDKELLTFCWKKEDKCAAKQVMGDLRKYLVQVSKSQIQAWQEEVERDRQGKRDVEIKLSSVEVEVQKMKVEIAAMKRDAKHYSL